MGTTTQSMLSLVPGLSTLMDSSPANTSWVLGFTPSRRDLPGLTHSLC